MENFLAFSLEELPYIAAVLVIAFTLHEFAHAYVAYKFGDPTAKKQGRLTLNPLVHLDPIGTIAILIAGFGWARPVPVNRFFFKNPRLAGVLVSVAGPVSNLLIAFIGMALWYSIGSFGSGNISFQMAEILNQFFPMLIHINILLFVFNLLPLPPLDGYRIIEDLVPTDVRVKMTQYEGYGVFIFLFLIITPLAHYTIYPIFNTVIPFIYELFHSILS